ncbi:MAG TPA: hypothetical protein VL285_05610 [Bryobacteraceae bacterium]|jgi:hypothetical protein|nr:hypothetical protein [Bryobacteraceae bacterium]
MTRTFTLLALLAGSLAAQDPAADAARAKTNQSTIWVNRPKPANCPPE